MMNANELADVLENDYWDSCVNKVMLEGAKTLRQQQAEIEALKSENKFFKDLMGDVEILRKVSEA
jgi:hypothetical protein